MTPLSRRLVLAAAVSTVFVSPGLAAWPEKSVTFIVANSPGGGIDIQSRILGEALEKKWGQKVVIDFKPGAGGSIAADFVSRAAPDGSTYVVVGSAHAVTPSLLKVNYDAVKSFAPVTQLMDIRASSPSRAIRRGRR